MLKGVIFATRSDGPPSTHSAVRNFATNVAFHQLVDFYDKSVNVPDLLQHVFPLGEQLTASFAVTAFSTDDSSITFNLHLSEAKSPRTGVIAADGHWQLRFGHVACGVK